MVLTVGIDEGHTLTGPNYGAEGIMKESEETRIVGKMVIEKLIKKGCKVINCTIDKAPTQSESLNGRIRIANAQRLDLFVSLHFNKSAGGYGTEVLTVNAKYMPEADRVLKNMEKIGFRNRGIKTALTSAGGKVAVVHRTNARAMLIEVCFVDSKSDVDRYRANLDKVAEAIASGIVGDNFSNSNIQEDDDMIPDTVKISACSSSSIANAMIEKIKILQGIVKINQDGIATEKIVNNLPQLKGAEQKGCVTIMQQILIIKGFLSKGSDTGVIGQANKDAIGRFKKANGIPEGTVLVDKLVWRKLMEY